MSDDKKQQNSKNISDETIDDRESSSVPERVSSSDDGPDIEVEEVSASVSEEAKFPFKAKDLDNEVILSEEWKTPQNQTEAVEIPLAPEVILNSSTEEDNDSQLDDVQKIVSKGRRFSLEEFESPDGSESDSSAKSVPVQAEMNDTNVGNFYESTAQDSPKADSIPAPNAAVSSPEPHVTELSLLNEDDAKLTGNKASSMESENSSYIPSKSISTPFFIAESPDDPVPAPEKSISEVSDESENSEESAENQSVSVENAQLPALPESETDFIEERGLSEPLASDSSAPSVFDQDSSAATYSDVTAQTDSASERSEELV